MGAGLKHQDWPTRLAVFVAENEKRPFVWGDWDCCLMACDAVETLRPDCVGISGFRGTYKSRRGAYARLKRTGGGVVEAWAGIAAARGLMEIAPGFASRGDVVSLQTELGAALGICLGRNVAVVTKEGMRMVPRRVIEKAWRV